MAEVMRSNSLMILFSKLRICTKRLLVVVRSKLGNCDNAECVGQCLHPCPASSSTAWPCRSHHGLTKGVHVLPAKLERPNFLVGK